MPTNDNYRRAPGVRAHHFAKNGNYYEPNDFGELLVECWCGGCLQLVQQLELLEGLTKSCSAKACRETDELERARHHLRAKATA